MGGRLDDNRPTGVATRRLWTRGSFLAMAGAPATKVVLITSGLTRVIVPDYEPGREMTTALLGPGQIVGVTALTGAPAYHSSVLAVTRVEGWAMPADQVMDAIAEDPVLARHVLKALSNRLGLTRGLLGDMVLLPVAQRIPGVMARLSSCSGGGEPHLSRKLLASLIGARRETVSRAASGGAC
jgi:CRP-like cAMP-binding protein